MLILKQNTFKKMQMDKTTSQLKFDKIDNSKKYKIEKICDHLVYTKMSKSHLLGIYYLVL